MPKAVTGRRNSGTGGCLPYPFLGHRTTFACEKERWFPLSPQVTGVLSTPLQLSFPGRTWLLLFKVPCTSAYAPTSLLSYLWEKLENAQWHTGELVPSVSCSWKVFLFRILRGKDRWHSYDKCCLHQCKIPTSQERRGRIKAGARKMGSVEWMSTITWMFENCGDLDENAPPYRLTVLMFGSQSEDSLERIRWCGLIGGGVPLRLAFEVSKVHVSLCPLCLYLADKMQALSYWSSTMPACLLPCFLFHWSWTNLWL